MVSFGAYTETWSAGSPRATAIQSLVGLTARDSTGPLATNGGPIGSPDWASHVHTKPSSPPASTRDESAEKAMALVGPVSRTAESGPWIERHEVVSKSSTRS